MRTIPEQQLADRWDTLPMIFREAMTSPINSEFLWKTAEGEHLPEEKIRIVSKLTGWVLMGFIHPEDLADKIKDNLGINQNIAATIASALNARIFSPLRVELDKVYAPAVSGAELPAVEEKPEAPKIMEEIKKPEPTGRQTTDNRQQQTPPPAPKPAFIPVPSSPSDTMTRHSVPAPAPKPFTAATAIPAPMPAPVKMPPAPASQQSAASSKPAPVIIHQESEFQPIRQSSSFKLEIPMPEARGQKPQWTAPPRPAQIEMGNIPAPSPIPPKPKPASANQQPDTSRVVHYSELKTSLPASPPKPGEKPEVKIPPAPIARPSIFASPLPKPAAEIPKPKPSFEKSLPDPLKEPELPGPSS